jgi:hypothetical protein
LTTWRITVRAIDRSTRVGQQTATFIVRKDLMIRLGLPRFFRARDRGQVAATIHNSQEKPAQVKVKFEAQGISINGATEQVISLDKRSRQTLFWNYEAQQAGTARFTAYALSEGLSDAEQLDIPVLPHGTEVVEASSRIVEKERDSLTLKPNFGGTAQPEGVAAQLTLSPSLAGPLMASLEYLVAYPYGCVEQTMSAFLPTVLVAQTTKELGGEMPQSGKLKDIPQMVAKGLARLYNYQHEDGGWGWWENDPTHSFMTAYALYGLTRAQQAGFEVDQTVLERGRNSLISLLGQTDLDLATRAYMLYVLKQAGSTDRTMIEKLFARRKELAKNMNPMTRALMVETLAAHGLASEARALLEELLAEAQRVDSLVYWEGQSWHYNWQDDPLLTTAAALRAILAVEPKRAEAVGAMRFLMSRKLDERSWRSTLDTAQIVYVLVDYMKARRELSADFEVEVRAGGKRVLNQRFDKGDLFKAPVALPIPSEVLKDGVEIKKTGAGNLYATLRTSYYTQEEGIAPRSGGSLRIDRRYEHLALTRQGDKFIYRRTPLGENAVVAPGDLVLVTIAPTTTADSEYVMIEDMLPSGFEVIADTRGWRIEGLPVHEYEEYGWGEWYSHREVRDNRVAFFVTYFGRGQKEPMRYILRAQTRGDYHVMPARVEVMYYPDTRATSPETRIRVE